MNFCAIKEKTHHCIKNIHVISVFALLHSTGALLLNGSHKQGKYTCRTHRCKLRNNLPKVQNQSSPETVV